MTAFGVFWGIFMLVALMGGSQGNAGDAGIPVRRIRYQFGFMGTNQTSKAYKGFRKGRWWDLENKDVERVRRAIPEIDVVTPTIAKWGMTALYKRK